MKPVGTANRSLTLDRCVDNYHIRLIKFLDRRPRSLIRFDLMVELDEETFE